MSKKKDSDAWGYGGVKRRDFQHTHAGPEEMPHKKKKKKINRSKCAHEYQLTLLSGKLSILDNGI